MRSDAVSGPSDAGAVGGNFGYDNYADGENRKLFESKKVRTHWDEKTEQWYFSVIDVIEILTDSKLPKRYWSDMKTKLKAEGSEVYEKIVRLKMLAEVAKCAKRTLPTPKYCFG